MAAAAAVIGLFIIFLSSASSQHLGVSSSRRSGVCLSIYSNSVRTLNRLNDCVVIVGNLRLVLMENTVSSHFSNFSFPNLREVTGFIVLYRVIGLESVGQLFPNLSRIRGNQLINNYALVVHDMVNLKEIGLYDLLQIDRGGVIIWGGKHTCYIHSIDWSAIAPQSRHILTYPDSPDMTTHCNTIKSCKCGGQNSNYCWNSKKCQRFLTGPRAESCHPECLGCKSTDPNICSVCRHYTHSGKCVSQCPPETIILPDSQYCLTPNECVSLGGWNWNNTCVFDCPAGYEKIEYNGTPNCEPCLNCRKVCPTLSIDSLSGIQQADKCVYINGSLTIHVRSVPGAVDELKKYLKLIEVVADYIDIYACTAITSLDFLPNLRQISGKNLKKNLYSLIVDDMKNLKELFTPTVMKYLEIDRGKLKVVNNPMLCMSRINELKAKFPVQSNAIEIPPELNGYSGGCDDSIGLTVEVLNETTAVVTFSRRNDSKAQYTVLYVKVPSESRRKIVPETCSESEWFVINTNESRVLLTSLHPGSTYAVCIETFVYSENPVQSYLARTSIVNFTMSFTKPEPPFIHEMIASSSNTVRIRWVDHRDYRKLITSYELDVILIDIPPKDVTLRDHCNKHYIYDVKEEYSRHSLVFKTPVGYESCEADCLALISFPKNSTMLEEYFDVCSSIESDCNHYEEARPKNSSFKNYVNTLALNISGPSKIFHIEGLAPFRDYKIRLRACVGEKCSRSTRGVIRTLLLKTADIPLVTEASINDTSHIYVKWEPPDETNGPILVYFVQVLPGGTTTNETFPDVWCVYPEVHSLVVRSRTAKEFQVRVCSSTLGSFSTCSEWRRISMSEFNIPVLGSIVFSITLIVISLAIGYFFKRRRDNIDSMPLVDMTSMYRSETEPPAAMFDDFMPFYSVSFNEALAND